MRFFDPLRREAIYLAAITRSLRRMRSVTPDSTHSITDIVADFAKTKPENAAILYRDATISYRALDASANRYAHWAHAQGIRRGDAVALFMENRPDYVMAWLGLAKLGAVTALINTNLRGTPLAHSIQVATPRHVIVGEELAPSYLEARALMAAPPVGWSAGGSVAGLEDLDVALSQSSDTAIDPAWREGFTLKDKAFYIYTSGTTGLPKAANFSHMRLLFMMIGFAAGLGAKESDRMYNVLPLYHSAGGVAALGPAFITGGSVVIRRRFSVREFWEDCHTYRPTFFEYIGELCRYLLNAPPDPFERAHNLRAIIGNGLRPEIWPQFQKRFAIPKIVEFYGATEGNVAFINYDGKMGSVGRLPRYMRKRIATRLVRFDFDRELPLRGPDGFCIECQPGETGEAIGQIVEEAGRRFEGYTDTADTEKKILRDVFEKGDRWFRTGDLLRSDEEGYFYFVDRIGDTFRWKGENVATSEVAEALGAIEGIKEANVYGVAVPGMDGRAGMAALVAVKDFDVGGLAAKLEGALPAYARPVFLRFQPAIEVTGTFKQRKVELVKDGFNPAIVQTPLYWLNPGTSRYEPLTSSGYTDIVSGRVKL
jgi:fatty-acyl-CoA synthase